LSAIEPLEGKAARAVQVPEGCTLVMFDGAVRSSKTVSSLLMWLRYIMDGPKGALAIVGRTETTAINNVVLPLQEMLGTARVVINRGLGTVTIMGRTCQLYGANDAAAYTKIQGMTLAGAYVDEGAVIAQTFYNMLRSRLSVPGAMLFLTCNPEGPKHWLKREWLDRAEWHLDAKGELHHYQDWDADGRPLHLKLWRVTFLLDDNTYLARHNPSFVAELKSSWPKGSMFHRRYIGSEWVSADGAVYGMWDESRMTVDPDDVPRVDQVLMVGADFGSEHPTRAYALGLVYVALDPKGRPLWREAVTYNQPGTAMLVVLDEFAPELRTTVSEQAQQMAAWLQTIQRRWGQPEWVAVDPAAKAFSDELHALGLITMRAHNAVVPGIQTVQSLLHAGRLLIAYAKAKDGQPARGCPHLVGAIDGYMWDTKASERGETKPVKVNDDEVDALRYTLYTSRRYWRDHVALAHLPLPDQEDAAA